MGNIVLGLELLASGGAATIAELKKIQQGIRDTKNESTATTQTNQQFGGSVAELASKYFLVTQAVQAFIGIAKPAYDALIGQNVELQQQLLGTQASLAATNKVLSGGVEITDPTKAIQALEGPVNAAVDKIRKGSLDLVGVTSEQLIPIFQNVAGQSSAIGASLDDSAALTLKFAATLGTLNVPLVQQRQEISSILQGTIDQNSIVAKTLGITNEQVNNWKTQGTLVSELSKRLEPFVAGNALAAQTIGGVSSNIQEVIQNITLLAGKPLTEEVAKDLNEVFKFLKDNQDTIQQFVTEGADKILFLIQTFKEGGTEIAENFEPVLKELQPIFEKLGPVFDIVVIGLTKLAATATQLVADNPALKIFLAIANGALTAIQSLESLNGEYAAGVEAAEIYRQSSSKVAQEAVDALAKTKRGTQDAAKARTEAIAKINDELKALKDSNLRGEENRAVVRNQITELERLKGALQGGSDGIKLISKDTQQYTNQLKQQTEQYKQQTEALSANLAIQNAQLNQARASGLISEREFAARSLAVEQANSAEKVTLAQKRVADIAALEAKTNDPQQKKQFEFDRLKAVTEAAQAEISIAQKTVERRKQLQANQLKDLEQAQSKANDAIAASESALLLQAEQGYQRDLTQKQLYELKKLGIAQARIDAEIAAEEERTKTLQKLTFSDPDEKEANEAKIRASKQKTASLTLKALENQRQIEQSIAEIQIKQINDRAAFEKRNNDERNRQLGEEKNGIENITQSLERQGKLRTAQNDLAKAQISLLETSATIQTSGLDRALELRKKLNDQTTDPAVARVLRQQLEALTGDRNTSEVEILRRKFALENSISSLKAIALAQEQDAARNALKIEAQRNELAAKRAIIEARIAEINSRTALIEAKKNLADLKKTPGADPTAIADAAQAVKDAQSNVGLATGNVQSAISDLEQQKNLAPLAERTLAAQQASARAQQQAAEYARQQAAQLTIVEAKSKAIAAGNFRDKFTPEDFAPIRPPTIQVPSARETAQFIRANGTGTISPQPSQITVQPTNTAVLEAKTDELIKINRDLALRLLQQERNTFSQTNYYGQKSSVLRGSGL